MRRAAGLLLAMSLAACARVPDRAVSAEAAARLRADCPAGSFIGTMTVNCPQVRR